MGESRVERMTSLRAVEKETDLRFENGLHAYTLAQAFTCVPTHDL